MKLLILADSFSVDGKNPWLVEDLVGALVQDGHQVQVVANDRTRPRPRGAQQEHPCGARVLSVGCTTAPRSVWHRRARLVTSLALYRPRVLRLVGHDRFDGVIFSSLAFTKMRTAQKLVQRRSARRSLLIHWDFFPRHHVEIGGPLAPQKLFARPLFRFERWAVSGTDAVAVMSAKNREFYRDYFGIDPPVMVVQPPWGVDLNSPGSGGRAEPDGPTVAVFGGQLTAGRGVDDVLRAAEFLQQDGTGIAIRIYGDGPARTSLQRMSHELGLTNVEFRGNVSRDEYVRALAEAHCGIAATVPNVTIPSFPSKIVDYAGASLPIVVATEASSDVGQVVTGRQAGWTCPAGDPRHLAVSLKEVDESRKNGSWARVSGAARAWFEENLSAPAAARSLVEALAEQPCARQ